MIEPSQTAGDRGVLNGLRRRTARTQSDGSGWAELTAKRGNFGQRSAFPDGSIHPVPRDQDYEAYFALLRDLKACQTDSSRSPLGASHRWGPWGAGIATECGFGRQAPDRGQCI